MTATTGPIRFNSKVGLCLAFLIIFLGAVAVAGLKYPPKAAEMPLLVGGFGAALSLLQLVIELVGSRAGGEDRVNLGKDLPVYAWVWAFALTIVALGFLIGGPLILLAYLKLRSRESWRLSLALSAGVLAVLYGLFVVALGVPLFEGLVTPVVTDWLFPG